jgi:hypothetical protein
MGKSSIVLAIHDSGRYTQIDLSPHLPLKKTHSEAQVEQSSQKQHDYYALHTVNEDTNAIFEPPEEQVLGSIASVVYQTHRSIMSDDRVLCQQVSRIYHGLSEQPMQMQQLRTAIAQAEQSRYNRADTALDVSEGTVGQAVKHDVAEGHDSFTTDVFLNYVSRFSVNDPNSPIDRLHTSFSGSPDYYLKTSPVHSLFQSILRSSPFSVPVQSPFQPIHCTNPFSAPVHSPYQPIHCTSLRISPVSIPLQSPYHSSLRTSTFFVPVQFPYQSSHLIPYLSDD